MVGRPSPTGRRRSRGAPRRSRWSSSIVVIGGLAWVVVNAPGWPEVQKDFLNGPIFWASLPGLLNAFWKNVELFLIAEVLILPFGLLIAVLRGLPGRCSSRSGSSATVYVDVFRALPGLLVIFVLGFGIPGLGIPGVPNEPFFWGVVALTLIYSAYVSEVYRAGIESVHPSQEAAARSLGLSRFQSMRYVVLPQAVRRVDPAAAQRLHRPPEGHGPRLVHRRRRDLPDGPDQAGGHVQLHARTSAVAFVFLVLTIPLARLHRLAGRSREAAVAAGGGR